jgi:hypothetical protein
LVRQSVTKLREATRTVSQKPMAEATGHLRAQGDAGTHSDLPGGRACNVERARRVKELAAKDPALAERQPFKAVLEHDYDTLFGLGLQALYELAFATHAGTRLR